MEQGDNDEEEEEEEEEEEGAAGSGAGSGGAATSETPLKRRRIPVTSPPVPGRRRVTHALDALAPATFTERLPALPKSQMEGLRKHVHPDAESSFGALFDEENSRRHFTELVASATSVFPEAIDGESLTPEHLHWGLDLACYLLSTNTSLKQGKGAAEIMGSYNAAVQLVSALSWKGLPCSGDSDVPALLLVAFLFQGASTNSGVSFAQMFRR